MDLFWRACLLSCFGIAVTIVMAAAQHPGAAIAAIGFTGVAVLVAVMTVDAP